jgi:flagella basal body P-ring formation protein FlgA
MRILFVILLFASSLSAAPGDSVIARLAEAAWLPLKVYAEWQPAGTIPAVIGEHDDWKLANLHSTRLAGSIVLTLERAGANGIERTAVSGTLRVDGPSLMVKHAIRAGVALQPSDVETVQADWTYVQDDILQEAKLQSPCVAARSLVPGRVLTVRDIKSAPRIHRGQSVELVYTEGVVRVRLTGRALQDGAVGDHVAVVVDMKTSRKFEGCVAADGTVQWIR